MKRHAWGAKPSGISVNMLILATMRFNPNLKTKRGHLYTSGKPAKVAIVAVARKLIEMATALVKAN